VRRRVETEGWVVAGFLHRTSREGDPQLHSHCLVPNLVQRTVDGRHVAFDANPLHDWARAAGSIYQNHLQRTLSFRLGVGWGPDRHNTREMVGFTRKHLQTFSKRSAQIEAELERQGARYESPALRMQADDAASLATRSPKDHSLTPALLIDRWRSEASEANLATGRKLERLVCTGRRDRSRPSWEQLVAALVDEERGLCARSARFTEADAVEHLCAISGGRLTAEEITELAGRFLSSGLAVRLIPEIEAGQRRRPPEWSTAAHRALEDETVSLLDQLINRPVTAVSDRAIKESLAREGRLGPDQIDAVRVLTGEGGSLRTVLSPAGHGKTAMAHAAAAAAGLDGRRVVAVATTAKAVAELAEAGLAGRTIAQLRIDLEHGPLAPGTVVIIDEISQSPTRDVRTALAAVAACPGGMVWILGDPRQAQSVAAGGMADELQRLADAGRVPAATLTANRRQIEAADREALRLLRNGRAAESQHVRSEHGWEHEHATPGVSRAVMAQAVCKDIETCGAEAVVALTVSHRDAEDVADRIRARQVKEGKLAGRAVIGPGWSGEREYRAGDRVLLHARCGHREDRLFNGTTGTVERVNRTGLAVRADDGRRVVLPKEFVEGTRRDGSPNLSHAWARTVDGAQGGTWECAHLLGTSALDAFRGYAGQSRSRQPTRTWNTAKVPTVDFGGQLADRRSGAEQVAAALEREPDPRLAARSDPYLLERELLRQIGEHDAILRRWRPDRSAAITRVEKELTGTLQSQARLEAAAAATRAQLDQLGLLTSMRSSGRQRREDLESKLGADLAAAHDAAKAVAGIEQRLTQLRGEQSEHDRFEHQHGWRRSEVVALRDQLNHHWTDVVLVCVAADDPLGYGIDKLREARQTLARDIWQLDHSIPDDRSQEWNAARRELTEAVQARQAARQAVDDAQRHADQAAQRRWGRRDQQAIDQANNRLSAEQDCWDTAVKREATIRDRLGHLSEHQDQRRHKLAETHGRRVELAGALERLDVTLDDTRPDRVETLVTEPPDHLIRVLGPVPDSAVGQEVWCHLAGKLEAHLDRGRSEMAARDALCRELDVTEYRLSQLSELIAEQASSGPAAPVRQPPPGNWDTPNHEIDRGRGRGRGL
jgi:hypothetical protein